MAGVIGSPLSSYLMIAFDGWHGLSGWKWMFIIEGGITVVLGVLAWFVLADKPASARYLSDSEKQCWPRHSQRRLQALPRMRAPAKCWRSCARRSPWR
ncbi:hypothetical protein [Pseudomonas sp. KNUC1026]|uniref:hypothetical protein n=1 Tax=Pseudomonas sp. KNUC1026 TaxID=2893890 RepID=UPI001F209812|nr:hypothetical protein [Pseudomonas sp. KNUC1026]UFH51208.1 hypothetical protein LN139_09315 [Pseudomonas sp. KNUC1026]